MSEFVKLMRWHKNTYQEIILALDSISYITTPAFFDHHLYGFVIYLQSPNDVIYIATLVHAKEEKPFIEFQYQLLSRLLKPLDISTNAREKQQQIKNAPKNES